MTCADCRPHATAAQALRKQNRELRLVNERLQAHLDLARHAADRARADAAEARNALCAYERSVNQLGDDPTTTEER